MKQEGNFIVSRVYLDTDCFQQSLKACFREVNCRQGVLKGKTAETIDRKLLKGLGDLDSMTENP